MRTTKALLAGLILLLLVACASMGPKPVWHSFVADGWEDNWGKHVQLLEYQYENGQSMGRTFTPNGLTHEAIAANFLANPAGSGVTPMANGVKVATDVARTGTGNDRELDRGPLQPGAHRKSIRNAHTHRRLAA